ncbi:hypothetical protein QOZ80_5BG0456430 [Eleusine coracana subsp. coracana]|nr:hypothetical protein QOZ80_5BG0456430 [Eleusine coracana subsp. coracana]
MATQFPLPATTDTAPPALQTDPPPIVRLDKGLMMLSKFADLLSMLCKFILVCLVIVTVSSLIALATGFYFYVVYYHPQQNHHPQVTSAVLATFNLPSSSPPNNNNNNALLCDLTLNITFNNRKSVTKVRFDNVIAGLYYNGTKIGPSDYSAPSFMLKQEGSRTVSLALRGQASNATAAAVAEAFVRERLLEQFNLNVRVKAMVNFMFFPHRMTYYYEYNCNLQFPPVPGDGTPAVTGGIECSVPE